MADATAFFIDLVETIADGDTLTGLDGGFQQVKFPLTEIDASESRQAFGIRSRQSLGELRHDKRAEMLVADVDQYKRIAARVFCVGVDTNAAQVHRGMEWGYERYAKSTPCRTT